jgi:ferric iron reductase protein FhuF
MNADIQDALIWQRIACVFWLIVELKATAVDRHLAAHHTWRHMLFVLLAIVRNNWKISFILRESASSADK